MALNIALLKELEHEAAKTRKMLERVPMEKADWKPHEKSYSLGSLAIHIARLPSWVERVNTSDEFDVAKGVLPKLPGNSEELLTFFDTNIAAATRNLQGATDELLMKPWTFRNGERIIFTAPKVSVIRNMGLNHIYHHRGQLSVYLRLLNIPVPGMFGPSADER